MLGTIIFLIIALILLVCGIRWIINDNRRVNERRAETRDKLSKLQKEYEKVRAKFDEEYDALLQKKHCLIETDGNIFEKYMTFENNKDGEAILRTYMVSLPQEPKWETVNNTLPYRRGSIFAVPSLLGEGAGEENEDVKVDDILYFKVIGDISYTTELEKGFIDTSPAVSGAIMYGAVGAAVGTANVVANAVNSLESKTVEHDDREIIMKFKNAREEYFTMCYKEAFMNFIPEKEYDFVMMNQKQV